MPVYVARGCNHVPLLAHSSLSSDGSDIDAYDLSNIRKETIDATKAKDGACGFSIKETSHDTLVPGMIVTHVA